MGYKPLCTHDGKYERKQCHWGGNNEYCWCVDPETGKGIDGSKKGSGEDVNCEEIGKYMNILSYLKTLFDLEYLLIWIPTRNFVYSFLVKL